MWHFSSLMVVLVGFFAVGGKYGGSAPFFDSLVASQTRPLAAFVHLVASNTTSLLIKWTYAEIHGWGNKRPVNKTNIEWREDIRVRSGKDSTILDGAVQQLLISNLKPGTRYRITMTTYGNPSEDGTYSYQFNSPVFFRTYSEYSSADFVCVHACMPCVKVHLGSLLLICGLWQGETLFCWGCWQQVWFIILQSRRVSSSHLFVWTFAKCQLWSRYNGFEILISREHYKQMRCLQDADEMS